LDHKKNRVTYSLYDKRREMHVGEERMSDLRNFPHIMTLLSDTCKYSVVTSQMHRFNRRCFYAYDFINETVAYCRKLIEAGYNKLEVIAKVVHFKHWQPQKGKWEFVLAVMRRRILAIED
jgi:hypothetical protein